MDDDVLCWLCGSNLVVKEVLTVDKKVTILISCDSCLTDLIAMDTCQ